VRHRHPLTLPHHILAHYTLDPGPTQVGGGRGLGEQGRTRALPRAARAGGRHAWWRRPELCAPRPAALRRRRPAAGAGCCSAPHRAAALRDRMRIAPAIPPARRRPRPALSPAPRRADPRGTALPLHGR
jgi:hypothetical protein